MYIDRIREVFLRYNYNGNSHMNQQNFYNFLSQLSVYLYIFSLVRHTIGMLLMSYGNKPPKGHNLSRSIACAILLAMESTFCKWNSTKSMVCIFPLRWDQVVGERKNTSLQLSEWGQPLSCQQNIKWYFCTPSGQRIVWGRLEIGDLTVWH